MTGTSPASGSAVAVCSVPAEGGSAIPPLSHELVNGSLGPFEFFLSPFEFEFEFFLSLFDFKFDFFRSLFDFDEQRRGSVTDIPKIPILIA